MVNVRAEVIIYHVQCDSPRMLIPIFKLHGELIEIVILEFFNILGKDRTFKLLRFS